ncbi:TIGR03089 family protein [soil metagenome]
MSGLAGLLARISDPSRPFVTYYDESVPERVELSAITTTNWVNKTANMLTEGFDAERGMSVRLDVPSHWETYVWLLASWTVGLVVTDGPADIAVLGPDLAGEPGAELTFALSLRPMGLRFLSPPAGCIDYNAEVLGFGDHFFSLDPPADESPAMRWGGVEKSHADLVASVEPRGTRMLLEPADLPTDVAALVGALSGGGSLVLAARCSAEQLASIARDEQATPS